MKNDLATGLFEQVNVVLKAISRGRKEQLFEAKASIRSLDGNDECRTCTYYVANLDGSYEKNQISHILGTNVCDGGLPVPYS